MNGTAGLGLLAGRRWNSSALWEAGEGTQFGG